MGIFRRQLRTVVERNYWTLRKKATYLIAALNQPAAHVLAGVPNRATCRGATEVLENRYGDYHLEAACNSQLKMIQLVGESRQEFVAAIAHLAHRAHIKLPEHLISKEVAHVFSSGIRERDVR
jgi:hypothetical protein